MPTVSYFVYTASALNFSGSTVTLSNAFDPDDDRLVVEITDDDNNLDGDYSDNEDGFDTNQTGVVFESDGVTLSNVIPANDQGAPIYAENQLVMTGSDGSSLEMYRLEIDGTLVGYLPTSPLDPNVTYTFSTFNVVSQDEFPFTLPDIYLPQPFTDENGDSTIDGATICFTSDALVMTDNGECRIGDLVIGDRVATRDNGMQPIRWIFRRKVTKEELRAHPSLCPVVFEADALGRGMPSRRSRVSPQHRILIETSRSELLFGEPLTLAPAKGLVTGYSIWQDFECEDVEYVHILFENHELIKADGLYSESFHPGAWSLQTLVEEARQELLALFPELAEAPEKYGKSCYPSLSVREAHLLAA